MRRSADLRLGGTWGPLQRVKNDFFWTVACLALAATRRLPYPALRAVGRALGAAAHELCPSARRTALANVRRVFPDLEDRQQRAFVEECFASLGEVLGETVALLRPLHAECSRPPLLTVGDEARELIAQARTQGHGVIFASAHLGPWERVAASLVAAGIPLVTIARESYDPRFSRLYDRLRTAYGVGVVWRGSPGAAMRIVRTLRGGGVLGVPMDLRARVASCDVPFLGHDAPTAMGPALLALRTGAAVVVGSAAPSDRLCATPRSSAPGQPLSVTATRIRTHDLPRGSHGVRELTARINDELSRRILTLPHAWVWMHERWNLPMRV